MEQYTYIHLCMYITIRAPAHASGGAVDTKDDQRGLPFLALYTIITRVSKMERKR